MTQAELREKLVKLREAEGAAGQPVFLDIPDRWYERPHWRCCNDHVSTMYLKAEKEGDSCLKCYAPVYLTFPEDKDGPLV